MKNFYSVLALSLMISTTTLISCTPDYVDYDGEAVGAGIDKTKLVGKWDLKTKKVKTTTMGQSVDMPAENVSSGNSIHVEFKDDGTATTIYNTNNSSENALFPKLVSYNINGSVLDLNLSSNSTLQVSVGTLNATKLIFTHKQTVNLAGMETIIETSYNFSKL